MTAKDVDHLKRAMVVAAGREVRASAAVSRAVSTLTVYRSWEARRRSRAVRARARAALVAARETLHPSAGNDDDRA